MRALIVDDEFVEPVRDGGARAVADLLRTLGELGHEAVVARSDAVPDGRWDAVLVSRPVTAARLYGQLRPVCDGPLIYLGHDLHHRRLAMLAEQGEGDPGPVVAMRSLERVCWRNYDLSVYPSAAEVAEVRAAGGTAEWFPYFRIEAVERPSSSRPQMDPNRVGLLFVGGPRHLPNVTGLRWFGHEVLPRLSDAVGAPDVAVVGDWPRSDRRDLELLGLDFHGPLSDEGLTALGARATAVIVPLRAGAGVKSKTIAGLGSGVPVIATSVGLQGVPAADTLAFRADDPDEWAVAVRTIVASPQVAARTVEAARRFVTATYGADAYRSAVAGLVAGGRT